VNPVICFKYCSGASALRCLSEGTFYFARRDQLNDSLEVAFEFADTEAYIQALNAGMRAIAASRGLPTAFSFDRRATHILDAIIREENDKFRTACQRVGIFSAASRPDNQPMWAYYAKDSMGVCFEMEWSPQIFEKYGLCPVDVTYQSTARIHNPAQAMCELLYVMANDRPKATIAELQEMTLGENFRRRFGIYLTAKVASVKHSDWAHEKEVRIIAGASTSIPVVEDVLKRVYFTRTDFPEWGSIMKLLYQLYPNVKPMQVTFAHTEPFPRFEQMGYKLVPASDAAQATDQTER
jgi:hypothetical protein